MSVDAKIERNSLNALISVCKKQHKIKYSISNLNVVNDIACFSLFPTRHAMSLLTKSNLPK